MSRTASERLDELRTSARIVRSLPPERVRDVERVVGYARRTGRLEGLLYPRSFVEAAGKLGLSHVEMTELLLRQIDELAHKVETRLLLDPCEDTACMCPTCNETEHLTGIGGTLGSPAGCYCPAHVGYGFDRAFGALHAAEKDPL